MFLFLLFTSSSFIIGTLGVKAGLTEGSPDLLLCLQLCGPIVDLDRGPELLLRLSGHERVW
jgi:hypothetical protein